MDTRWAKSGQLLLASGEARCSLKIVRRWAVFVLGVGAGTLGIQYWLLRHSGTWEIMDTWQGVGVYGSRKESLRTGPRGLDCGVVFGLVRLSIGITIIIEYLLYVI